MVAAWFPAVSVFHHALGREDDAATKGFIVSLTPKKKSAKQAYLAHPARSPVSVTRNNHSVLALG
jgi:hypothetical protein